MAISNITEYGYLELICRQPLNQYSGVVSLIVASGDLQREGRQVNDRLSSLRTDCFSLSSCRSNVLVYRDLNNSSARNTLSLDCNFPA